MVTGPRQGDELQLNTLTTLDQDSVSIATKKPVALSRSGETTVSCVLI
jgi:hypothetical protein